MEDLLKPGEEGFIELEGYVRKDIFGRLFLDRCESDEVHLTSPRGVPDAERPGCRKYFEDFLVPTSLLGKRITFRGRIKVSELKETK